MSAAWEVPPEIVEPVAAASDFVTVLTSRDRLLTKQIYQKPDGTSGLKDFDGGYEFDMATHTVAGLEDLHRLYDLLTASQCVVIGRIIGNEDLQQVRRLKYPDGDDDPARLEDAAHNYIPIDLDSILKPDDLDPIADPEGAIRYVVEEVLPQEFHDVTCSWRHTSSAGIKPGIRMRLNFWGDRQTTGAELRRWLGKHNIDSSIYTCNQPIYAAAPKLLNGTRDPIRRRSGIYRGQYDIVAVPDIPVDEPHGSTNGGGTGERPVGYSGFCALIGDHEGGMGFFEPVKKATASWIATQGAGADLEWLRADLERVIKAAPRDKALHDDKYIEKRIKDLKRLTTRIDDIQAVDEAKRSEGPPWQIKAGEPYATAKRLRELRYSVGDAPTLHHHRARSTHGTARPIPRSTPGRSGRAHTSSWTSASCG